MSGNFHEDLSNFLCCWRH